MRLSTTTPIALGLLLVGCPPVDSPSPDPPVEDVGPPIGVPAFGPPPIPECPAPFTDEELASMEPNGCERLLTTTTIARVRLTAIEPVTSPLDWSSWPDEIERPADAVCIATSTNDVPLIDIGLSLEFETLDVLFGEEPVERARIAHSERGTNPFPRLDEDGGIRWIFREGPNQGGQLAIGLELVLFLTYVEAHDLWLVRHEMFWRDGDDVVRQERDDGQPYCQQTPAQEHHEELLAQATYSAFESGILDCAASLSPEAKARREQTLAWEQEWLAEATPAALGGARCWMTPENFASLDDG